MGDGVADRAPGLRMLKLRTAELPLRADWFMPVARAAVVAVPAPDVGGRAAGADTGSGARPPVGRPKTRHAVTRLEPSAVRSAYGGPMITTAPDRAECPSVPLRERASHGACPVADPGRGRRRLTPPAYAGRRRGPRPGGAGGLA
ncbi:hypothetical protein GCM10010276_06710 [Streptomyces longisporus]|uniref:Uncharacterized protein n=1 Tax=Streptomyces longisporus TaxID=1948 RepID=A0ABP5Y6B4_STRLO